MGAHLNCMSFWDGKKVLVTGGAGFVGSHLTERLVTSGADVGVVVADDFSRGEQANIAGVMESIRIDTADIEKAADCDRICKGIDVVFHLAARVGGVGRNAKHPATMFRRNLRMSSYMLEAAAKAGVERFCVVSSACVYRRDCTIPTPEDEGFVDWPEETNVGYGWAKRMAEFEAYAVNREFGLAVAIARPYNAYGPRDHFDPVNGHVIGSLIRRVLKGENPLKVWGDGSQTRAFLYVDDFVRGLMEVTENYAECDPVNLGSDEEVTIKKLAETIVELSGLKTEIEFDSSKPSGQPRRNCDSRKARETFGFTAEVPLREGLRRTMDWYRKNHEAKLDTSHV